MRLLRLLRSGRNSAVAAFLFFFLVNVFFLNLGAGKAVRQPILFNHAKHIENGMSCTDCHVGAEEQAHATLPDLAVCLNCHESALGKSPEEAKIRTIAFPDYCSVASYVMYVCCLWRADSANLASCVLRNPYPCTGGASGARSA